MADDTPPKRGCPCGLDHSDHPRFSLVQKLVEESGETVTVTCPGGRWKVPRLFIAVHGLAAPEVAALADRYGWEKVS